MGCICVVLADRMDVAGKPGLSTMPVNSSRIDQTDIDPLRAAGAHKGPAFFAYSDNYLIDLKFGVIVDVEASRSIRQAEVGAARTMIERTEERFGLKPERLVGDTAYGAAPMLNWLVEEKGIAPHIPVFDKSKRNDGTFSRGDFRYDPTGDVYHCPGGSSLGQVAPCMRARRFCIVPASSTAMYARSNPSAAQKSHHARSRAISMSMPATSHGRWLAPRTLSSRGASGRRSRCGLRTSSSAGFDCAVHEAPRMSSFWPLSPRTCDGSPRWSPGRHPLRPCVLRSVGVA